MYCSQQQNFCANSYQSTSEEKDKTERQEELNQKLLVIYGQLKPRLVEEDNDDMMVQIPTESKSSLRQRNQQQERENVEHLPIYQPLKDHMEPKMDNDMENLQQSRLFQEEKQDLVEDQESSMRLERIPSIQNPKSLEQQINQISESNSSNEMDSQSEQSTDSMESTNCQTQYHANYMPGADDEVYQNNESAMVQQIDYFEQQQQDEKQHFSQTNKQEYVCELCHKKIEGSQFMIQCQICCSHVSYHLDCELPKNIAKCSRCHQENEH